MAQVAQVAQVESLLIIIITTLLLHNYKGEFNLLKYQRIFRIFSRAPARKALVQLNKKLQIFFLN